MCRSALRNHHSRRFGEGRPTVTMKMVGRRRSEDRAGRAAVRPRRAVSGAARPFDGKVCLEIPPFQRPYVWNEEDQWQPLWDDLERVTVDLLAAAGLACLPGTRLL